MTRRSTNELEQAAWEALGAYRAIGMGPGGWKARDREAFAHLEAVLHDRLEVRDWWTRHSASGIAARIRLAILAARASWRDTGRGAP